MQRRMHRLAAALACGLIAVAATTGAAGSDGERKVPKEAEKALGAVAASFRKGDAAGLCAHVEPGKDGRIYLRLAGVTPGAYTREQATEALQTMYFANRTVVNLTPGEDCTSCDDANATRSYRVRWRVGEQESDGTLTIHVVRKTAGEGAPAWYLASMRD